MTHDHDHAGFVGSTPHNGHRPNAFEVRNLKTEPGFEPRVNGRPASAPWNDDSARKADDALMRCYNG